VTGSQAVEARDACRPSGVRAGPPATATGITTAGLVATLLATGACAGATLGSGVGDRILEHPPWEAGRNPVEGMVAHPPIAYQAGASQPAQFDPGRGPHSPMGKLLGEMNAFLDGFEGSRPVGTGRPPAGLPPDVMFGCEVDAAGDCLPWEIGRPGMRLAVARPSSDWVQWAREVMGEADALLLVTVEVGQYLPRQRNLLGAKEVELGRDHRVSLPWLTSLETPVSVLQVTGALINREGRALRIAAEGMLVRRTSLLASSAGLQALITDEEVEQARTARRADLPGRPLVWQVALRNLVEGLLRERP
jgi:hypothetical protein